MSLLAHAIRAAPDNGLYKPSSRQMRKELDDAIQAEIREAQRIQQELGCTYAEALRIAALRGKHVP